MSGLPSSYTPDEQTLLLKIARQALEAATSGQDIPVPDGETLPGALREERACFVTLQIDGELRGCTGTLVARRGLAQEVAVTAVQTAFHDPRFLPVTAQEVPSIQIEISVLTPSVLLDYDQPADLPRLLHPQVDGVTLQLGHHRSTFLPQVWERVSDPDEFLTMLTRKMGLPGDTWRERKMHVEIYHSVTIIEPEPYSNRH